MVSSSNFLVKHRAKELTFLCRKLPSLLPVRTEMTDNSMKGVMKFITIVMGFLMTQHTKYDSLTLSRRHFKICLLLLFLQNRF